MKMSKKLQELIEKAKKTDSYWATRAKLDFAQALEARRRLAHLTYANIAEKIGASVPYVSKVFRGDSNLTIESMVKLARATGGQLDVRVVDGATSISKWNLAHLPTKPRAIATQAAVITYQSARPANDGRFEQLYRTA